MNKSEMMSFVKSDSMKMFVPASDITTHEIMDIHNGVGYNIGFTFDELKSVFPESVAKNLYYNSGFEKTFYFDKEKLILFSVSLFGKKSLKSYDELTKEIEERAMEIEKSIKKSDFYPSLMVLNDKMRMEFLNLLIEQDKIKDAYPLFTAFYQDSDYGCSELSFDSIRKLQKTKDDEHKAETEERLKDLPERVTIYRGEGDMSSRWQNSVSWTTDINVANFFASRMESREGRIVVATVDKKDIIEYFEYEDECIVLPESVKVQEIIQIEGVDYIERNLPRVMEAYKDYRDLITDWLDFEIDDDEHGRLHSARVLLNCLLIAKQQGLSSYHTDILAIAAVFHDTMRKNNDTDIVHGNDSANYYKEFAKDHPALVNYNKTVEQLIKYHCLPDEIGRSEIKEKHRHLFDIFKDADALDRVRFGIRNLDINQLRTQEAKSMTMIADILRQNIELPEQELEQGMEML